MILRGRRMLSKLQRRLTSRFEVLKVELIISTVSCIHDIGEGLDVSALCQKIVDRPNIIGGVQGRIRVDRGGGRRRRSRRRLNGLCIALKVLIGMVTSGPTGSWHEGIHDRFVFAKLLTNANKFV